MLIYYYMSPNWAIFVLCQSARAHLGLPHEQNMYSITFISYP